MAPRTVAPLLLFLLLAGCGYRLAGMPGERLREGGLWVAPIEDDGDEPLFGPQVAKELAREAVNRASARIATRRQAEVYLRVRLDSIRETAIAFTVSDLVKEYVLTATATASVLRSDGELVWKGTGIRVDREFPAGDTVNETESNKDEALALLARDLAREVLRRAILSVE